MMKLFALSLFFLTFNAVANNFVPKSFSANYEESLTSATGKVKKSFGKVDYKFPGHLKFEVTSPMASTLIVNPQKTWFYQPAFVKGEKDQVTIQKSSNLPLVKFLDSIKDGTDKSNLFKTSFNKNDLVLSFNKKGQDETGLEEVILHSSTDAKLVKDIKGFEHLTLKYTNKNKTSIKLIDFKENISFSEDYFQFKPDANTKVIE
jgi:outer membrane lipoprotein-sorting protein